MKFLSKLYIALIIFFLYAPVLVMIVFSFNSSKSVWVFEGFSTRWYQSLATNSNMLTALEHTLIVAVASALISTVLGTAAAVGIVKIRKKLYKKFVMSTTQIPMMNADIVTGISLMFFTVNGKVREQMMEDLAISRAGKLKERTGTSTEDGEQTE